MITSGFLAVSVIATATPSLQLGPKRGNSMRAYKMLHPIAPRELKVFSLAILFALISGMFIASGAAKATVLEGPTISPVNGNEYYLISTPSWTAAEAEAVSLGGHLVTIRSAEENSWVFDNFIGGRSFNSFWIGLNDAAVEGSFVWSSGEPVTYTSWNSLEPNDWGGVEDYAWYNSAGN